MTDAAEAYRDQLDEGGKMFVAIAGAMSTAELGLSLAEMIRQDKVYAICCTGANIEEDRYNLVAHDHYVRVPNYRELTPAQEQGLLERNLNRVTDTCIPEEEAIRRVEDAILDEWTRTEDAGERYYVVADGTLEVRRSSVAVATVGRGDGVGEVSVLLGIPCTATTTATRTALLYALEAEPFIEDVTATRPARGGRPPGERARPQPAPGSRRAATLRLTPPAPPSPR